MGRHDRGDSAGGRRRRWRLGGCRHHPAADADGRRGQRGNGPAPISGPRFDGESGNLDGISTRRNAWLSGAAAKNGSAGLRVSSSNAAGYARWDGGAIAQNRQHASVRFWVRLVSRRAGQSVDLFTLANARGSRNFDFFIAGDTGRFKWDIYRTSADESSFAVTPGQWYLVEARISYQGTSHTARVRIDGVDQGTISSPGSNTTVASATVGSFTAKTHTQDYDDIAIDVGTQPLGWITPGAGGGAAGRVTVSWNPVVDAESGLLEYQIWRNNSWYAWAPAGTTTFVDTAPVAGANYRIRAVDNARNRSGWSARAYVDDAAPGPDVTPPTTPRNVAVVPGNNGTAVLTWDPVTDSGGSGLREYAIFRNGRWYDWVPADVTRFVDAAPVPGSTYRVRAYDKALNRSDYSVAVSL